MVLVAAYAHELPRYGLEVGVTNYVAAYCTRLVLACQVLKTLEMDEEYEGNVEGALDGRLDIPHSDKRFVGVYKESKQLDPEVHRKYVCGGHVATYMRAHFSEYIMRGINEDGLEEMYKKVHDAIRVDPTLMKSEKQPPKEQ
ncbi:60S ribosomal protein L5-2 [Abeliophyllum distichum]|uniref:60S ribosomal protein L5-2 n=1 Tax=Abeliophyllum distichum TaxID=126358 RepID=A0ABD1TIS7_9LAMI